MDIKFSASTDHESLALTDFSDLSYTAPLSEAEQNLFFSELALRAESEVIPSLKDLELVSFDTNSFLRELNQSDFKYLDQRGIVNDFIKGMTERTSMLKVAA